MDSLDAQIRQLRAVVARSRNLVFFGGAGVSTESGIPDFRSADGLYAQAPASHYARTPEEMLSRRFFDRHPDEFYRFYRERVLAPDAQPNAAHRALAALEQPAGPLQAIITQNIDGLHQAAGSHNVIELHGSVWRNFCTDCGRAYTLDYVADPVHPVALCQTCGGIVKPDVVLYQEQLADSDIQRSLEYLQAADTLIVGGTSLAVYPAAGLLRAFGGQVLVIINRDPTPSDSCADLVINAPIGQVLSGLQ
ncbi:MAG: NAD-dependent protein deacylase [Actinomycetes bacterium]|jgi:NAD-dependent deacetylase|nr:NAD-dependent protein deacylase [Actinomycetes bacterium]